MSKFVLRNGTPFPKPVGYEDIDVTFCKWVEDLRLSFNGELLPIFKFYSIQRINEYGQTWEHLDDNNNIMMNFIDITREYNIKKGEQQGNLYNIPGEHRYPMFVTPVLQDDGSECYDVYYMKQPYCVDINYKVQVVSDKLKAINQINNVIQGAFKALQAYISPNGYYMSMKLGDVSDNTEFSVEERRFYSQSFSITVRGYIINKEDFSVEHLSTFVNVTQSLDGMSDKRRNVRLGVEEWANPCNKPEQGEEFANVGIKFLVGFDKCERYVEFTSDRDFDLEELFLDNVYDISIFVNEEYITIEDGVSFQAKDKVRIEISQEDEFKASLVELRGNNPNEVVDLASDKELVSDDDVEEEIIRVGNSN